MCEVITQIPWVDDQDGGDAVIIPQKTLSNRAQPKLLFKEETAVRLHI